MPMLLVAQATQLYQYALLHPSSHANTTQPSQLQLVIVTL